MNSLRTAGRWAMPNAGELPKEIFVFAAEPVEAGHELVLDLEERLGLAVDEHARLGRPEPGAGAIEEGATVLVLEELDAPRHRGLGDAQDVGRAGQAARLHDFDQRLQIDGFHAAWAVRSHHNSVWPSITT